MSIANGMEIQSTLTADCLIALPAVSTDTNHQVLRFFILDCQSNMQAHAKVRTP
ncbi:hypothetical protein [Prosthecobacter sp.]|uniref:hypothetical protein n=1 Tax=Prosthecobacter sp. TaxID=1965333 RepID=UPI003782F9AE